MYKLKQIPKDFIVREVSNIQVKDSGKYLYYKLTKKNYNTLDAIKEISKNLGIKEKNIGYAGSKDKNAITEQIISFHMINKAKIEKININEIELEFIGFGDEPITLGDLKGNKFEIVVRENEGFEKREHVVNYFDEQRFSKNNVAIGRYLIKKEFNEATKLIGCYVNGNNHIGALQKIPLRLLKIYVHAYQSYLWNKCVKKYLEKKFRIIKKVKYSQGEFVFTKEYNDLKIPLIGFAEENDELYEEIMKEEEISYIDFIIKQIPEISAEGDFRDVFVKIEDLEITKYDENELNSIRTTDKVSFFLPKGSYATIVIKLLYN